MIELTNRVLAAPDLLVAVLVGLPAEVRDLVLAAPVLPVAVPVDDQSRLCPVIVAGLARDLLVDDQGRDRLQTAIH